MRTVSNKKTLGGLTLALTLFAPLTPALAEEPKPERPYMQEFMVLTNKRADWRSKAAKLGVEGAYAEWLKETRPEAYERYQRQLEQERERRTASSPTLIKASRHPMRVDFKALLSKRADLRINVARYGMDRAFTDWMRHERPVRYQAYVRSLQQEQERKTAQK